MVALPPVPIDRISITHRQHDATSTPYADASVERVRRTVEVEPWPAPGEVVSEIGASLALHLACVSAIVLALAAFATP